MNLLEGSFLGEPVKEILMEQKGPVAPLLPAKTGDLSFAKPCLGHPVPETARSRHDGKAGLVGSVGGIIAIKIFKLYRHAMNPLPEIQMRHSKLVLIRQQYPFTQLTLLPFHIPSPLLSADQEFSSDSPESRHRPSFFLHIQPIRFLREFQLRVLISPLHSAPSFHFPFFCPDGR